MCEETITPVTIELRHADKLWAVWTGVAGVDLKQSIVLQSKEYDQDEMPQAVESDLMIERISYHNGYVIKSDW